MSYKDFKNVWSILLCLSVFGSGSIHADFRQSIHNVRLWAGNKCNGLNLRKLDYIAASTMIGGLVVTAGHKWNQKRQKANLDKKASLDKVLDELKSVVSEGLGKLPNEDFKHGEDERLSGEVGTPGCPTAFDKVSIPWNLPPGAYLYLKNLQFAFRDRDKNLEQDTYFVDQIHDFCEIHSSDYSDVQRAKFFAREKFTCNLKTIQDERNQSQISDSRQRNLEIVLKSNADSQDSVEKLHNRLRDGRIKGFSDNEWKAQQRAEAQQRLREVNFVYWAAMSVCLPGMSFRLRRRKAQRKKDANPPVLLSNFSAYLSRRKAEAHVNEFDWVANTKKWDANQKDSSQEMEEVQRKTQRPREASSVYSAVF